MYDSNVLAAQAALFADFEVLFEFAHLAQNLVLLFIIPILLLDYSFLTVVDLKYILQWGIYVFIFEAEVAAVCIFPSFWQKICDF